MGKDLKGKELGKGLSQRKDGLYTARYTDNFGKRQTIYDSKLAVVRKKLNEELYKKEHNIFSQNCNMTLNEWVDAWSQIYYRNTVTVGSYIQVMACYDRCVRNSELGNIKISNIRNVHIQRFVNNLVEERNISRSSILPYLRAIKLSLEKACECEYISNNPAERISLPKSETKSRSALSKREQELFLFYSEGSRYHNLFRFLLLTGVRVGEAIALLWDDIDLQKRTININKTAVMTKKHQRHLYQLQGYDVSDNVAAVITPPKTQQSNRLIPMNEACYKLLTKMYTIRKKETNIVFCSQNNNYLIVTSIDKAIKEICNTINTNSEEKIQRFSAHTFRHTFATRCFENGVSPKTVQYLLGHSSMNTTMNIYTHISMEQAEKEVQTINIIDI